MRPDFTPVKFGVEVVSPRLSTIGVSSTGGHLRRACPSVWGGSIECMFEGCTEGELLEVMRAAQQSVRIATAREVLAVGTFGLRRMAAADGEHDYWCVDDWEAIAAEVAAELGISRGRASSYLGYGKTLLEQFPKLAGVFAAGDVDFRVIRIIDFRTGLITDAEALAAIDEMLAHRARGWNALSDRRIAQLLDWMVLDVDPDAVRVAKQHDDDRHIEVRPDQYGTAEIFGRVRATDGAAFDQRLDALAATVCGDDPRTKRQRRADAAGRWPTVRRHWRACADRIGARPPDRPPTARRWWSMCWPRRPPSTATATSRDFWPATGRYRRRPSPSWPSVPSCAPSSCPKTRQLNPSTGPRPHWPNSSGAAI